MRQQLRRYSASGVAHARDDHRIVDFRGYQDLAAGIREFDRVVDEISNDLNEPRLVAPYWKRELRNLHPQIVLHGLRERARRVDCVLEDPAQINRIAPDFE